MACDRPAATMCEAHNAHVGMSNHRLHQVLNPLLVDAKALTIRLTRVCIDAMELAEVLVVLPLRSSDHTALDPIGVLG